jgi:hypothetical protein
MRAEGGRLRKIGSQRCRDELVCAMPGEDFQSRGACQAPLIQLIGRLEERAESQGTDTPTKLLLLSPGIRGNIGVVSTPGSPYAPTPRNRYSRRQAGRVCASKHQSRAGTCRPSIPFTPNFSL